MKRLIALALTLASVSASAEPNWSVRDLRSQSGKQFTLAETSVDTSSGTFRFEVWCPPSGPLVQIRFPIIMAQPGTPAWVRVSIDEGEPLKVAARSSKVDTHVLALDPQHIHAVLDRIAQGRVASVQASSADGKLMTFNLDAEGFAEQFKSLRKRCGL